MNSTEEQKGLTFWNHVDELRLVLIKSLAAIAVCAIVAFLFKETLFRFILYPKQEDFITYRLFADIQNWFIESNLHDVFSVQLINTGLATQFMMHMKTALYVGVLCASPYIIYQLFRFVSPALYANERRYTLRMVISGYVMFLLGASICYFLLFPLTFRFLATYQVSNEVTNLISLQSYIDTLMMMTLLMGIVFEMPVLCWLLAKLNFISSSFMCRYRRHAIVIMLVIAAIITPTSDIFTLLLVAFPMLLLYETSILIVRLTRSAQ